MKAIAAMSLNRVIGRGGVLPWHLPEEFRWFKETTRGHTVLMGRKTFESLGGKPLPHRRNLVLTRGAALAGVETIREVAEIPRDAGEVSVIGGAEIYRQLLPQCSDLFLTLVLRVVEGDTFFPEFESRFVLAETLRRTPEFEIRHYRRA